MRLFLGVWNKTFCPIPHVWIILLRNLIFSPGAEAFAARSFPAGAFPAVDFPAGNFPAGDFRQAVYGVGSEVIP